MSEANTLANEEEGRNTNKYKEVSRLSVVPFENDSCRSHLTFTIKGQDYTWSMSNYSLLSVIENYLATSMGLNGSREYDRILQ